MLLSKPRFSFPLPGSCQSCNDIEQGNGKGVKILPFQVAYYCMKRHFHFERLRFPWKAYLNNNMLRALILLSCRLTTRCFTSRKIHYARVLYQDKCHSLDPHDPQFTGLHFGPCLTHRVVRGMYVQLGVLESFSLKAKSMITSGQ
jgi:hypothetical protein